MNGEHPTPNAPNPAVPQHYACEQPENPDTMNVLWHASCIGCRIALEAAFIANPGLVLCTHAASYEADLVLYTHGAWCSEEQR